MHSLNLGLAYDVNGAAMMLVHNVWYSVGDSFWLWVSYFWQILFSERNYCPNLRACLLRVNYFSVDDELPLQKKLDAAYDAFKAWLRSERIQCSQPPFKVNMDIRLDFIFWQVFLFQDCTLLSFWNTLLRQKYGKDVNTWFGPAVHSFFCVCVWQLRFSKKMVALSSLRRPLMDVCWQNGSLGVWQKQRSIQTCTPTLKIKLISWPHARILVI